ncbi:dihydropteroate synthase [Vulcanisaeta thermophila]|uniref:dihydropteroate synthase n=1 Tax=Vulcanisaeta thermophila TaxID=867917 RepID=UPI00085366D2|nr:dihydropteroate synthase [Vulcanisaeta thermophila]
MIVSFLGRLALGDGYSVRLMGVVNVSHESFFKGSVVRSVDEAIRVVGGMVSNGVDVIDVGGMSTAPYNRTWVSVDEELNRVVPIVRAIKREFPDLVVSVDTFRSRVAEEALNAGADVINDVTGLRGDPGMARVVANHGASVVIMAREVRPTTGLDPVTRTITALRESISIALNAGVDERRIVVDPGVGAWPPLEIDPALHGGEPLSPDYVRGDPRYPWYVWDSMLIMSVGRIRSELGRPVLIGISRKSFLTKLMRRNAPPEGRLYASVSAEAIAVLMGVDAVRTHNVAETRDAVRVAEALRLCLNTRECPEGLVKFLA